MTNDDGAIEFVPYLDQVESERGKKFVCLLNLTEMPFIQDNLNELSRHSLNLFFDKCLI